MLKGIFQSFHLKTKDSDIGYFNILKFHALIYFKENIRLYRCIDGYCTSINGEAKHCYIIKTFYNLINKQDLLS